jgi:acetolactate synthase-1/2/3 large subunit
MFSNSGSASMGYDLPAAIGASIAAPLQRVICLCGDGSLQMNIQELATIAQHQLTIKIFVFCNGGYHSIRSTQKSFFNNLVGEGPESGVAFPDFVKVAEAYGVPAKRFDTNNPEEDLREILSAPGPQLICVELDRDQTFEPKLSSKRLADGSMVTAPLEDMAPFLDRDEFATNMIVDEEK